MPVVSTHTPGPWEAIHVSGAGWSVRKEHERPGYTGKAPICTLAWWQFDIPGIIDDDISAANARLIAAAPDLLFALRDIMASYEANDSRGIGEAIMASSAAILKAEGGVS